MVFRSGERGHCAGAGAGALILWDPVSQGGAVSLTTCRWKMTREKNLEPRNGATLGDWEVDAQGEGVEVVPSGEEVVLGGACPASWTCLVKTGELKRCAVF